MAYTGEPPEAEEFSTSRAPLRYRELMNGSVVAEGPFSPSYLDRGIHVENWHIGPPTLGVGAHCLPLELGVQLGGLPGPQKQEVGRF